MILLSVNIVAAIVYAALMLTYRKGWAAKQETTALDNYLPKTKLSVIIPAKDEEDNIAACIGSVLAQNYPKGLLEIIVVDDHSEDSTAFIVKQYENDDVQYIDLSQELNDKELLAYKKAALATGINKSNGELIITTDADCTASKYWLRDIAYEYEQNDPVMIVAPVDYNSNSSVLQVFQSLDFMSMQGITVASLELQLGNMCNGANLAFKRSAFDAVDGYRGVDHLASGDDYLLMMKLNNSFPSKITYLKSTSAIVSTAPQKNWWSFLQQRIRWASKSGKYDDKKMTGILMFVYVYNLLFLVVAIAALIQPLYWLLLISMVVFKTQVELLYLYPVAKFYNKVKQLWVFPLLQPLHIFYIILTGLLGFIGVYQWKGRKVR